MTMPAFMTRLYGRFTNQDTESGLSLIFFCLICSMNHINHNVYRRERKNDNNNNNNNNNDKISNGNSTEWSPIRSVIIRVINKITRESDLFNHEYDFRPNWTTRSSVTS